jgi:hypothetical protein
MADMTANAGPVAFGATRAEGMRAEGTGGLSGRLAATRYAGGNGLGTTNAGAALAEYNARSATPLDKLRIAVWMGGGIASLALVAGIGVWGYQVVKREVFGPPVVTAAAGEMRVAPADPGGEQAPNQGLAVNAIPAAGEVAPPSDVLTLAPPAPGLAPEDMEVVQTRAEEGEVPPAAPLAVTGVTATAALTAAPAAAAPAVPTDRPMTAEEVIAFADRIAAGAEAMAPAAPAAPAPDAPAVETALAPAAEGEAATVASLSIVPANVPGVVSAIRPPARPAAATLAAAAPAAAAAATVQTVSLTTDIPAGTNLVQLGAFESAEVAAREWERLNGRFGEFLSGHDRVIQRAESGGQTFYRLRATGFPELADARRLCAALVAENAQCIPVVAR